MIENLSVEELIKRDRVVLLLALSGITVLSWLYLIHFDRSMADPMDMMGMAGMSMPMMEAWRATDFFLPFLMWIVMVVGMMLPSPPPLPLTFATVTRRRAPRGRPSLPPGIFLPHYLSP